MNDAFENFWNVVRCESCGAVLFSSRSRRLGIGQRCKWIRDGRPTRKRISTLGQGMPIDDVPFVTTGTKIWVQVKLG